MVLEVWSNCKEMKDNACILMQIIGGGRGGGGGKQGLL